MKKRWLAMLVVGCMLIGSMGMTVMADEAAGDGKNNAAGEGNDPAIVSEDGETPAANEDFVVENGVLKQYKGAGGAVVIPDTVTSIGEGVFRPNAALTSVTIPNSVTSIGDYAFNGCVNLTSVTIPDSVTSIGDYAFSRCDSLASVTIPSSITSLGNNVFDSCSGLTSAVVENKIIGGYEFIRCPNLVEITLPEGLTTIGEYAFNQCINLKNVTIPNSVTDIGDCAFWCAGLTEISIPGSVTITGSAFDECKKLHTVILQEGIKNIPYFYDCPITSFYIPVSVTSIGQYELYVESLKDIYYAGTKQQWENISLHEKAFFSDADVTVHCQGDGTIIRISPSQPEESKPAPEEPKKNSGSSSSHSSGGSSQNNKTAPAPSEPKTEQEVVKETIENLPQGGQAVLETGSVIGSGELRKIMEKGGSMVVFSPQVSWHFDALTNGDMDFNPGIEVGADIPDLMQKLNGQSTASANATVLRFAHNGVLPGAAHAGIAVSYAPGTRLYFYYYNRSTGLFEFQQNVTVEEGGYVVVNLTHCSDYVLTTEPLSGNLANGPVPAAGTGSGANGAAQGKLDSTPHTGI